MLALQSVRSANTSSIADDSILPPGMSVEGHDLLQRMQFRFPLRGYQQEILDLVQQKLLKGERQLHLVAPPGAGKTIIGLQIISQMKSPSLILSPNTTIQSQWGQKIDLFLPPDLAERGTDELIGTHHNKPLKPITLLTYQVLSTPGREQEYLEHLAHNAWIDELRSGRSLGVGEAELRILELLQNNPKAHRQELGRHVSRLRRRLTEVLELKEVLHNNALDLLQWLRRQQFKLIIFDECHHLTDYWAAIMTHLVQYLDNPLIIGLTGTPPEGKTSSQENRYMSLVGDIDYQVPTPALVREGGLAPFQDLVYFTEPLADELQFLEEQHNDFHQLISELIAQPAEHSAQTGERSEKSLERSAKSDQRSAQQKNGNQQSANPANRVSPHFANLQLDSLPLLTAWVVTRLDDTLVSDGYTTKNWNDLVRSQPEFAGSLCRFLVSQGIKLPTAIDFCQDYVQPPTIDDWMNILEDFATRRLKPSPSSDHHKLYERIRSAVRKLGYGITERGLRRQASPADRVLAFSKSKAACVGHILDLEWASLQDRLRAVVVTDFEKMSATSTRTLEGILDSECGGAISTFKSLLNHPIGHFLNPCLVTGSLLAVDRRIKEQFMRAAEAYFDCEDRRMKLDIVDDDISPFIEITSVSQDWESRLYVAMATHIFEQGVSKCLVGTRGLFGEGWDSQALNTLIDLTTTTSPVSVKQLRGRSIRIQTKDASARKKVANNWDVVCIAPQLEKGLNDYLRFVRKHEGFFGISEDGQVECGVGHVHPTFSELTPADVFFSVRTLNNEMIAKSKARDKVYELWKVGQTYKNRLLGCVELKSLRRFALTPPYIRQNLQYHEHARGLRSALLGIYAEYAVLAVIAAAASASILAVHHWLTLLAALPPIFIMLLSQAKHRSLFRRMQQETCTPNSQESSLLDIASSVLAALQDRNLLPSWLTRNDIKIALRKDGSYRVLLENIGIEEAKHFNASFKEVMAPITNQPYLIPKYEYFAGSDFAATDSHEHHSQIGTYEEFSKRETEFFKSYVGGRAKSRIASYHAVPSALARSEKARQSFAQAWNKYVSPGAIVSTENKPELLDRYFGAGPSLSQRLLWE